MPKKPNYPSTELTTSQRELIARLVGPLKSRGISRAVFRELLAAAAFTVPKASLDRWVHSYLATGSVFTEEKASGPVSSRRAPMMTTPQHSVHGGSPLDYLAPAGVAGTRPATVSIPSSRKRPKGRTIVAPCSRRCRRCLNPLIEETPQGTKFSISKGISSVMSQSPHRGNAPRDFTSSIPRT